MKVASVSILCQDIRVFKAMNHAGTPCPYEGKVGKEASQAWIQNVDDRPDAEEYKARLERIAKAKQKQEKADRKDQENVESNKWKTFWSACKYERNEDNIYKSRNTCRREYAKLNTNP